MAEPVDAERSASATADDLYELANSLRRLGKTVWATRLEGLANHLPVLYAQYKKVESRWLIDAAARVAEASVERLRLMESPIRSTEENRAYHAACEALIERTREYLEAGRVILLPVGQEEP